MRSGAPQSTFQDAVKFGTTQLNRLDLYSDGNAEAARSGVRPQRGVGEALIDGKPQLATKLLARGCQLRLDFSSFAVEIDAIFNSIVFMNSNGNNSSFPVNRNRVFATTSWSMVLEAANESDSGGTESALSELCQQYWFPLYSFVRRKGLDRSQAEDLTQSFFAELLEKKRLQHAEPTRGSFRAFLLTSLTHFMANHWRAENTQKRGGADTTLSIDFEQADARYEGLPGESLTAERIFERNWALSILDQTLKAVSAQYEDTGKKELYDAIKGFLTGDFVPYQELAQATGMREGALKVAVHRLRQRYGQQLRLQIARTVTDSEQVDEELASLFKALE